MAMHCIDPNTIGKQTEELYNITNTQGGKIISTFKETLENLIVHWKGSAAIANEKELSSIYYDITEAIKDLQKKIVDTNNNQVLVLQKLIVSSGGQCSVGNELAFALNYDSTIAVPEGQVETWTDQAITLDAEIFNNLPTNFESFVNILMSAKEKLMSNWLDGDGRADMVATFDRFVQKVPDYKARLNRVKENLNVVAGYKKKS